MKTTLGLLSTIRRNPNLPKRHSNSVLFSTTSTANQMKQQQLEAALHQITEFEHHYKTAQQHLPESVFVDATVNITPGGIELVPHESPHKLRAELDTGLGLLFTRQRNFDLTYSWVSCLDNTPIKILANEVLDYSGTIIGDEL